jgi:glyoxylase-like metal-dependent hydrolase (beta-lactamase superfamily II)
VRAAVRRKHVLDREREQWAWLLREEKGEARPYTSGDRLPFGADVFPGHKANDTVLWVESLRAVISGDTLVDFGQGLEINERWLRPGVTREEIAEAAADTE